MRGSCDALVPPSYGWKGGLPRSAKIRSPSCWTFGGGTVPIPWSGRIGTNDVGAVGGCARDRLRLMRPFIASRNLILRPRTMHCFFMQPRFRTPFPPWMGLSRQSMHTPQSFSPAHAAMQPSHCMHLHAFALFCFSIIVRGPVREGGVARRRRREEAPSSGWGERNQKEGRAQGGRPRREKKGRGSRATRRLPRARKKKTEEGPTRARESRRPDDLFFLPPISNIKPRMPPSAWQLHLTKFRSSHPQLSLKQAMQGASKTYKKKASPKEEGAYRGRKSSNPWLAHVRRYRSARPGMSYADALRHARVSYGFGGGPVGGRAPEEIPWYNRNNDRSQEAYAEETCRIREEQQAAGKLKIPTGSDTSRPPQAVAEGDTYALSEIVTRIFEMLKKKNQTKFYIKLYDQQAIEIDLGKNELLLQAGDQGVIKHFSADLTKEDVFYLVKELFAGIKEVPSAPMDIDWISNPYHARHMNRRYH